MRILLDTHTVYWYTTGDFCLIRPAELASFSASGGDVRR